MKVQVTEEMVESPIAHLGEWQRIVDSAPSIACRFHEEVMTISEHLTLSQAYYRATAEYLHRNCIGTRSIDADLVVTFAEMGHGRYQLRTPRCSARTMTLLS